MQVTFVRSEQTARHIHTYYFSAEPRPRYIAGQFVELYLPHSPADSRFDRRWYTLSSAPCEELLAITTKIDETNKGSSFKQALRRLQPGDTVGMTSPMGDFVLPKDPSIPLTFVAGGIGITPFRSIILSVADSGEKRTIHVIYGVDGPEDIAFRETFQPLGDMFQTIIGRKLTSHDVLAVTSRERAYIYLSGPEAMVENVRQGLRSDGFDRRRVFTDFFPGYTA